MNKPSNSPMPVNQPQMPSQQQPPTLIAATAIAPTTTSITPTTTGASSVSTTPAVNYIQSTPISMKPTKQIFTTGSQVQQTPLALTTTSTISTTQIQVANTTKQQSTSVPSPLNPTTTVASSLGTPMVIPVTTQAHLTHQIIQSKVQPVQLQQQPQPHLLQQQQQQQQQQQNSSAINTTHSVQPITLTTAPSSTGPTALVIIPQHSAAATSTKGLTKVTPVNTTTIGLTPNQVTLGSTAATTQSSTQPIQLPTPIAAHVSNLTSITNAIASQQPPTTVPGPIQQHTLSTVAANRTNPTNLSVIPITTMPVNVKSEPNKYICCLLDNGIRCDRVAGNASFSARIQKIVGNKKMNFALDPTVRHAYICEHHKAIITVAKKSATISRDTKANAKNYVAQNNNSTTNNIGQHNPTAVAAAAATYNEISRQQQQNLHHPMNVDIINNQQQHVGRLTNNHTGKVDMMTGMIQGQHLPYSHHYQQASHTNQVESMNMMMPGSGIDVSGGDSLPSSSGGVEVDLQQLQVNTLRRYKRHFRVQTRPGLNKMQLAESLKSHFKTLPIIEKEAITYFVYIVKCYRNKLDHNPKAD